MSNRSHLTTEYVDELATRAGYYQAQAQGMQSAIRRYQNDPCTSNLLLVMRWAEVDLTADLNKLKETEA